MKNALRFAALGWKLFPAYWKDGHKPLVKWSENSSCDPEQIRKWAEKHEGCYFCVALKQSGLTVIDVDNKNGKNGSESLKGLELIYGELPVTLFSTTPSGGAHYYFKGLCAQTVEVIGGGVDTPGMVPIPCSEVTGKGGYALHSFGELNNLPAWVPGLAGKAKEKTEKVDPPAENLDLPHNILNAAEFAAEAEPATEGEGGDEHTYQMACKVRDHGLSETMCLSILQRLWNSKCSPPWSIEALKTKVENAYEYANSSPGENLPENDFEPIEVEADLPIPICDFTGTPPERDWLIRDWLPLGEVSSLYGKGGLGKSLIAIQLGMSIASKTPFLDMEVENSLPVLYVACEDSKDELHRRIHSIKGSAEYEFMNMKDIDMVLWPKVGKDATLARAVQNKLVAGVFVKEVHTALTAMGQGPKVLILDTLADFFAASENDRSMVNQFLKVVLGGMVKDFDCTVILLGHPAKASDSSYAGSTAWDNGVRTRWVLSNHENENLSDYRVLTRAKSNYATSGETMTLYWDRGVMRRIETTDIFDEKGDTDLHIMQQRICNQAVTEIPFGRHPNCSMYIHSAAIEDAKGNLMSKELKNALIVRLIEEGSIIEVKGDKHKNGLWPA